MGAIIGGVLSAIVVLLLIIFVWIMIKRKKQRKIDAARAATSLQAAQTREKSTISHQPRASGFYLDSEGVARTSLGSEEVTSHSLSMALEKHFQLFPAASDDPEHVTEGFEPQFSTRLVPRQHLRVMNPESEGPSSSPS